MTKRGELATTLLTMAEKMQDVLYGLSDTDSDNVNYETLSHLDDVRTAMGVENFKTLVETIDGLIYDLKTEFGKPGE